MKFRIQNSLPATVEMQLIRLSFGNLSKDDSQPAIISTLQDDTVSVTLFQLGKMEIFEYNIQFTFWYIIYRICRENWTTLFQSRRSLKVNR